MSLTAYYLSSGNIRLPDIFPFLGVTQLQVLSALSAVLLVITNGTTVLSVRERILLEPSFNGKLYGDNASHTGAVSTIKEIWASMWTLPYIIMRIVSECHNAPLSCLILTTSLQSPQCVVQFLCVLCTCDVSQILKRPL